MWMMIKGILRGRRPKVENRVSNVSRLPLSGKFPPKFEIRPELSVPVADFHTDGLE
jgi:hypothetical protein